MEPKKQDIGKGLFFKTINHTSMKNAPTQGDIIMIISVWAVILAIVLYVANSHKIKPWLNNLVAVNKIKLQYYLRKLKKRKA